MLLSRLLSTLTDSYVPFYMKPNALFFLLFIPFSANAEGQEGMADWYQVEAIKATFLYSIVLSCILVLIKRFRNKAVSYQGIIESIGFSFIVCVSFLIIAFIGGFLWYSTFAVPYILLVSQLK